MRARRSPARLSPIALHVHFTRSPGLVLAEAISGENLHHVLDHRWVAAQENLGVSWRWPEAPERRERVAAPQVLDVAGGAAPGCRFLGGAADGGNVGEVAAQSLQSHQLAAIAQVPAVPRPVQDGIT